MPKEYEYWRTGLVNYLNDGSFTKYTGQSKAEILLWGSQDIMMCRDVYFLSISEWAGHGARFIDEAIRINSSITRTVISFLWKHSIRRYFLKILSQF